MTEQDILKVVTSEYIKKYKVVTKEGKTEIVKLWRGNYDVIYQVEKGQRAKGRPIDEDVIDKWLSIALCSIID